MAGTGNWLEGMQFTSYSSQEQVQEWVNSLDLFKPDIHRGDANGDGNVNAGDAAFIAKKLAEASISIWNFYREWRMRVCFCMTEKYLHRTQQ